MCRLLIIYDLLIHTHLCTPDANGLFLWSSMNSRLPNPRWFVCPQWSQGYLREVYVYVPQVPTVFRLFFTMTITWWLFIMLYIGIAVTERVEINWPKRMGQTISANWSWNLGTSKSNPAHWFPFWFSIEPI